MSQKRMKRERGQLLSSFKLLGIGQQFCTAGFVQDMQRLLIYLTYNDRSCGGSIMKLSHHRIEQLLLVCFTCTFLYNYSLERRRHLYKSKILSNCRWMLPKHKAFAWWIFSERQKTLRLDRSAFYGTDKWSTFCTGIRFQKYRIWFIRNTHEYIEAFLQPGKITVWCGFTASHTI